LAPAHDDHYVEARARAKRADENRTEKSGRVWALPPQLFRHHSNGSLRRHAVAASIETGSPPSTPGLDSARTTAARRAQPVRWKAPRRSTPRNTVGSQMNAATAPSSMRSIG